MKSQVLSWFFITPPSAAPTIAYHWNVQTQRADVLFQCHHLDNQMSFLRCVWRGHGCLTIGAEKREDMRESYFKSLRNVF